jgi:hypothetical protein
MTNEEEQEDVVRVVVFIMTILAIGTFIILILLGK